MCSQITDLAFGGKCGAFGARGSSTAANAGALDSSPPASDSAPTPYPVLSRKSRRVVTLLMSSPHLFVNLEKPAVWLGAPAQMGQPFSDISFVAAGKRRDFC